MRLIKFKKKEEKSELRRKDGCLIWVIVAYSLEPVLQSIGLTDVLLNFPSLPKHHAPGVKRGGK